jgi:hypothetical protein
MTVRPMPTSRGGALDVAQMKSAGDAGPDTVAVCNYTTIDCPTIPPQSPCPRCGSPGPNCVSPGTPHDHQRLSCDQRGRWLRWLPRLRLGAQEGRP